MNSESSNTAPVRCAFYTRVATTTANPASAAAQEEICREAAATMYPKWIVADGCDSGDTGASGLRFGYSSHAEAATDICRVRGVKLSVVQSEAETICRIFRLFAGGTTAPAIARQLNDENIAGPFRTSARRASRAWNSTMVEAILRRRTYRGVFEWRLTTRLRNPTTGKVEVQQRPEREVVRVAAPDLRIVDDDLAAAVDKRLQIVTARSTNLS